MVHVPAILDEFFKPKSIHHACSVARRSKVIQYLKVLVKRRYPCETCHINQGLWIYQKMIEYDKIMLRKMSRTDPILMAKNGKNCLQFFTEPRLMLQLPLFEKKKKDKKCTISPFDPHAEFPHGDIPRSPPCASPLHGGWSLDHGRILFRIKGFKKRFHWRDLKIQWFLRWKKQQNLTSHGGLSRLRPAEEVECWWILPVQKWKYVEMM